MSYMVLTHSRLQTCHHWSNFFMTLQTATASCADFVQTLCRLCNEDIKQCSPEVTSQPSTAALTATQHRQLGRDRFFLPNEGLKSGLIHATIVPLQLSGLQWKSSWISSDRLNVTLYMLYLLNCTHPAMLKHLGNIS